MSISDNKNSHRFELNMDGQIVFANYKLESDKLFINYVESPVALRGSGAAGQLMEGIVQIAKDRNYKIIPICGYAVSWLHRHKEYQDLLA